MHKNSEMPILEEHSNMQQVLLEMTSKRLGCVGFINQEGKLQVASTSTAESITVTATSVFDNTKTGTATITVASGT